MLNEKKLVLHSDNMLYVALMIVAFFAVFVSAERVDVPEKQRMFLLPLGYFLVSLLFAVNYKQLTVNIPKLIIQSMFFVRLVLIPLLYSFDPGRQLYEGKASVSGSFAEACLLMLYEYVAVQAVIFFYEHTRHRIREDKVHFTSFDVCKVAVLCLGVYIAVIAIAFPDYTTPFRTILELDEVDFATSSRLEVLQIGSIGRILRTLFSLAVQLFRVLFPAYWIRVCYQRNAGRVATLVMVLGCVLQFFFLTSTFAEAVITSLALIMYYLQLYPTKRRTTFGFLVLSTVGIIVLYFGVRFFVKGIGGGQYVKDEGFLAYSRQILNAYFGGVDNVAAIFNVPDGYEIEAMRAGLLGAIPFNSTLFGDIGNKLQHFYNEFNVSSGQIPPTIGSGYYFFGAALSPVLTMLFVYLSLRLHDVAKQRGASMRYVSTVFCSIAFALSAGMYSPDITLQWVVSWGVIMLIITRFTAKEKGRRRAVPIP